MKIEYPAVGLRRSQNIRETSVRSDHSGYDLDDFLKFPLKISLVLIEL